MMKNVRSIFKNVTKELKVKFKESQCLLLISVGQESHEGDRFESTIELVNHSFHSCIILLYDTLQRHTMALGSEKDSSDFYWASKRQGDLWLERNEKYYSRLAIPLKIMRWDTWLNHPQYHFQRNQLIKTLTAQDQSYRAIFENTIDSYLERYIKRLSNTATFNRERAERLCFEYVLEECTVLALWPELNCQFELYPGKHNPAMEETRKRFILSSTPHLLQAVRLGFKNTDQIKPQYFELLD